MSVLSSRTQRILEAPVLPLLLSLAAPTIGEAAARITFLTAAAVFVSWLGSDALAGVAVVFPLFLILKTATASGFGSGVSSALERVRLYIEESFTFLVMTDQAAVPLNVGGGKKS